MQTLATILILILAVGYAAWRVREVFLHADDPCRGCSGCALKELKKAKKGEKADCWHKN